MPHLNWSSRSTSVSSNSLPRDVIRRLSRCPRTPCASRSPCHGQVEAPLAWLQLVAVCLSNALLAAPDSTFGLFYDPLVDMLDASRAEIGWAFSILVSVGLVTGLFASPFLDLYGCRPVAIFGSVLYTAGMVAAPFSPNLICFHVTYGFISGVGWGILLISGMTVIQHIFTYNRGLATGMVPFGFTLGTVLSPLLVEVLLDKYVTRGALLIHGGVAAHSLVFALAFKTEKKLGRHCFAFDTENDEENFSINQSDNIVDFSIKRVSFNPHVNQFDSTNLNETHEDIYDAETSDSKICSDTVCDRADPAGDGEESTLDPVGNGKKSAFDTVRNGEESALDPVGNGEESAFDTVSNGEESTLAPVGNGEESTLAPVGNGEESALDPVGNGQKSFRHPAEMDTQFECEFKGKERNRSKASDTHTSSDETPHGTDIAIIQKEKGNNIDVFTKNNCQNYDVPNGNIGIKVDEPNRSTGSDDLPITDSDISIEKSDKNNDLSIQDMDNSQGIPVEVMSNMHDISVEGTNHIEGTGNMHDISVQHTANIHDISFEDTGNINDTSVEGTGNIHDTAVEHAANIDDISVEHMANIDDISVEHTVNFHDISVEGTGNIHDISVEHTANIHDISVKSTGSIHDISVEHTANINDIPSEAMGKNHGKPIEDTDSNQDQSVPKTKQPEDTHGEITQCDTDQFGLNKADIDGNFGSSLDSTDNQSTSLQDNYSVQTESHLVREEVSLLHHNRTPSNDESLEYHDTKQRSNKCRKLKKSLLQNFVDFGICKDPVYVVFVFCNFTMNLSRLTVISHFPGAVLFRGLSRQAAATFLAVLGICNAIFRLLCTFVMNFDCVDPFVVYTTGLVSLSVAGFLAVYAVSYSSMMTCMVLMGVCEGISNTVFPMVIISIAGVNKFAKAVAILNAVVVFSPLIATPFSGWLVDVTGHYFWTFVFGGICGTIATIFGFTVIGVRFIKKWKIRRRDRIKRSLAA